MNEEILQKNLDNIQSDFDLFGTRVDKLSMKDRIGFAPISIWEPDWTKVKQLKAIIGDSAQSRTIKATGNNRLGRVELTHEYGFQPTASVFNPHLAQMILSAYCPPNAKIYDPFAGGGTRGLIASAMGHVYYGVEIRQEEVDRLEKQKVSLGKDFFLACGDAQEYPHKENFFDFSYTCPPYYNLEIYSDLPSDMSNAKTYDQFLSMLKNCVGGVYRGLKKGCLSVWVVGNFRDKSGVLTHLNGDLARIAKEVGFKLHDELIFWGASKSAVQRCGQFEANRKSVRVHEYILIFKK